MNLTVLALGDAEFRTPYGLEDWYVGYKDIYMTYSN